MPRPLLITAALSIAVAQSPPWRTSMGDCWTNVSCDRALIISHGGQWDLQYPYDSLPAFQRAYTTGTDSVKGDLRVSKDNVSMVMHSSPIEIYESIPCAGKRVEDTLAADLEKCTMALSNQTFISVNTLLEWAADKVIVSECGWVEAGASQECPQLRRLPPVLCVKESTDIARAISTIIEANATDRAFLEVHPSDLASLVPTLPGWEQVWFREFALVERWLVSRPRALPFEPPSL